ncbi:hypothetical protein VU14_15810 [Aeromonas hydrophila]|nr:hypothetical protein VU14_15810 [Aeromonas hydrophila]
MDKGLYVNPSIQECLTECLALFPSHCNRNRHHCIGKIGTLFFIFLSRMSNKITYIICNHFNGAHKTAIKIND